MRVILLFTILLSILVTEILGSEVIVLESTDFDKKIENGRWFIKFYAPWCGHCKNLAPIWTKLAKEQGEYLSSKEFYVAEVDCTLNGEICDRNEVEGYPSLFLFNNGEKIHSYEEDRSLEPLINFSRAKADELYIEPPHIEPPENVIVPDEDIEINNDNDDTPVLPNPTGTVVTLNSDNFDKLIGSGIWFIKFYAPWCIHCQKLAPTWEELGKVLKNKVNVGSVDCTLESGICGRFKVEGYPTLKLFQSVDDVIDYKGSRKLQNLQEFAEKITTVRIIDITAEALEEVKRNNEVFFIYFYDDSTPVGIMRTMKLLSRYFFTVKFYFSKDKNLASTLNVGKFPSFLVIKDDLQKTYPASSVDDFHKRIELKKWIQKERYPLVPAMDSGNYDDILGGSRLVVLGILDPNEVRNFDVNKVSLKEVAKLYYQQASDLDRSENGREVIFAWLDGIKWADYVYGIYGIRQKDLPTIIIADPTENKYYDTSRTGEKITLENKKQLLESIHDCETGHLTSKSTLGVVEATFNSIFSFGSQVVLYMLGNPIISLSFFVLVFATLWKCCNPRVKGDFERGYDKFE